MSDVELGNNNDVNPRRGFALVAAKINSETSNIYRRFDELSARNLLYHQAEIAELEEELTFLDDEDNSALAAHQLLLNSPPPSKSTITAFRNWFFKNSLGVKNGDKSPRLWGASSKVFSSPHDLIALRVPADQDRLSSFIHNNFGVFFQTSAPDGRTTYTSEADISRFVAILSTVLAAVLLFGAIISLYNVKNEKALLGMLSGWTVLFAACVGFLTNARRDQILALQLYDVSIYN